MKPEQIISALTLTAIVATFVFFTNAFQQKRVDIFNWSIKKNGRQQIQAAPPNNPATIKAVQDSTLLTIQFPQ